MGFNWGFKGLMLSFVTIISEQKTAIVCNFKIIATV